MKLTNEADRLNYKNVWVLTEFTPEGSVHSSTFELLGAARKLADDSGCEVWAVALKSKHAQTSRALVSYGADTVLEIEDERLGASTTSSSAARWKGSFANTGQTYCSARRPSGAAR